MQFQLIKFFDPFVHRLFFPPLDKNASHSISLIGSKEFLFYCCQLKEFLWVITHTAQIRGWKIEIELSSGIFFTDERIAPEWIEEIKFYVCVLIASNKNNPFPFPYTTRKKNKDNNNWWRRQQSRHRHTFYIFFLSTPRECECKPKECKTVFLRCVVILKAFYDVYFSASETSTTEVVFSGKKINTPRMQVYADERWIYDDVLHA